MAKIPPVPQTLYGLRNLFKQTVENIGRRRAFGSYYDIKPDAHERFLPKVQQIKKRNLKWEEENKNWMALLKNNDMNDKWLKTNRLYFTNLHVLKHYLIPTIAIFI